MKKLVFAAIAALVMVSVSNVFASNKVASNSSVNFVSPVDTVAPTDTATKAPAEPTAATPVVTTDTAAVAN